MWDWRAWQHTGGFWDDEVSAFGISFYLDTGGIRFRDNVTNAIIYTAGLGSCLITALLAGRIARKLRANA